MASKTFLVFLFSAFLSFAAALPASDPLPKVATTKGPKKIPYVPEAFIYKSEVILPESKKLPINTIRTTEEWFNAKSKVARVDVKPFGKDLGIVDLWNDDYGLNPLSIVHDYNTGHSYIMDKLVGNCSITPIKEGLDNKGDKSGPGRVQMVNASEFFDLTGADFQYAGTDQVGPVKVDVWKGFRQDWPKQVSTDLVTTNSWWTWKFLTDEWIEFSDNEENTDTHNIPYQLDLGFEMVVGQMEAFSFNYTFNYIDFTPSAPLDWDFDIKPCWDQFKERAMLAFTFPSKHKDIIADNVDKVKEMIHLIIRMSGFINTPTRISEPQLMFKKDDWDVEEVVVWVEILGLPPIEGNVKPDTSEPTPLVESLRIIMEMIEGNEFEIIIADPEHPDQTKTKVKAEHGWYRITGEHPANAGSHGSHYPCHARKIPDSEQTSNLPQLPDKFQAEVELIDHISGEMVRFVEYYDYENNEAAVNMIRNGTQVKLIYDFENKQILTIVEEVCFAADIGDGSKWLDMIFPFGQGKDHEHISAVKTLFDFADGFKELRLMNERVRDIKAEHYLACVHHEHEMNVTASIDWWFSSPEETMPLGPKFPRIPLKMQMKGVMTNGKETTPVDLTYTYVDFIPGGPGVMEEESKLFQSPPGVYCEGKKNLKNLVPPKSPNSFSYKAQITQPPSIIVNQKRVKNIETYFDAASKLTRLDHRSIANEPDVEGIPAATGNYREIHDFNTGIAYQQNLKTGECKILPIHDAITDSKESVDADGFKVVHIVNSTEFFHLDGEYQYVGKRKDENGVLMDVWITKKTDWPRPEHAGADTTNYITTLEWSFLDSSWTEMSDKDQETNATNVPYHLYMQLDIQEDGVEGSDIFMTYDYNIYDFVPEQPHWSVFDISLCMDQINKAHFVMDFPGSHKEFVWGNMPIVKDWLLISIDAWGQINDRLRVYDIEFDFRPENKTAGTEAYVTALFSILDITPVKGDAEHIVDQKPLDWIANQLEYAVNSGQFKFLIPNPQDPTQTGAVLTAIPQSFLEVDRFDVNFGKRFGPKGKGIYTAGAGWTAGIVAVVLGILVGVGSAYLFFRRRS